MKSYLAWSFIAYLKRHAPLPHDHAGIDVGLQRRAREWADGDTEPSLRIEHRLPVESMAYIGLPIWEPPSLFHEVEKYFWRIRETLFAF